MHRAKPYTINFPLTAEGTKNLDRMLKDLYQDKLVTQQTLGLLTFPTSFTVGDLVYASSAVALAGLADVAIGNVLLSGGVGVAPSYGKVPLTTHVSGILPIANGGTNSGTALTASAVAVSNGTQLVQGPLGTTTTVLHGNATGAPTYAKVDLANDTTGAVGPTQGGTGQTAVAIGDLLYGSALNTWSRLSAGLAGRYLRGGGAGTAPAWSSVILGNSSTVGALVIIAGDGSVDFTGIAPATANKVLRANGAGVPPVFSTFTMPDTYAKGDILTATAANVLGVIQPSTSGWVLTSNGAGLAASFQVLPVGTPHNLLDGSVDQDTLAGSVVRGDVIVGNSTPKWARLAIGTTGKLLRTDGTDVTWQKVTLTTDVSGVLPLENGGFGPSIGGVWNGLNDFRLTLTAGAPYADNASSTTIYATPVTGNSIALYDGTNWNIRTSAEFSLALGVLTSGKPYDVFCYDNATVPTLEFLVWTNNTTRATALSRMNGVYTKSGDATRRYLGTFYTISTTATQDNLLKRFLWNYDHRVRRALLRQETTASWTYTTSIFRQMNGSTTNQVEAIIGVSEDAFQLVMAAAAFSDTPGLAANIGIGEDSTVARQTSSLGGFMGIPSVGNPNGFYNFINYIPVAGYHFWAALENGGGAGTTTWYSPTVGNSGLSGHVMG